MIPASAPISPRPPNEDGFDVGSKIGRFRLIALLASGGMAHVWAAEPESSGGISRTVAIKVIRPDLAADPEYAKLFIDEATIATAVHHPNVCQTYELDRHHNVLFMAMEWVPGDSLAGLIRVASRFWPLDPAIGARICADACAGLHAAHEALDPDGRPLGVIHRDVSPANILVSLSGQVKVSDFGIAKARHQLHERTRTGEVKGKFGYLAPEQIAGDPTDRRADIYAMGCVLYTATLGLRPFGNGPEAMPKILLGEFKRPSEIDPTYPSGLEAIVLKALEQKPGNRFETADALREALETWLWEERIHVSQADIARTVKERMPKDAQQAIHRLQTRGRSKSDIAYELLKETLELIEPPTAATGILVPEEVRARALSSSPSPFRPSSAPTEKYDAAAIVLTSGTRQRGAAAESDRRHPEHSGKYLSPPPRTLGTAKPVASKPSASKPTAARPAAAKAGASKPSSKSGTKNVTTTRSGPSSRAPLVLGLIGALCLVGSVAFWLWTRAG
jgi:serine/threonine protein kinase